MILLKTAQYVSDAREQLSILISAFTQTMSLMEEELKQNKIARPVDNQVRCTRITSDALMKSDTLVGCSSADLLITAATDAIYQRYASKLCSFRDAINHAAKIEAATRADLISKQQFSTKACNISANHYVTHEETHAVICISTLPKNDVIVQSIAEAPKHVQILAMWVQSMLCLDGDDRISTLVYTGRDSGKVGHRSISESTLPSCDHSSLNTHSEIINWTAISGSGRIILVGITTNDISKILIIYYPRTHAQHYPLATARYANLDPTTLIVYGPLRSIKLMSHGERK